MTGSNDAGSRSRTIDQVVACWEGVTGHPHRFGGREYRLGRREIGHVHGESLVDVPLPRRVRDELVSSGRARPHHVMPESGWVSVPLHDGRDVEKAIEILRQSYEIALRQQAQRGGAEAPAAPRG